jgi:hypothetical protein
LEEFVVLPGESSEWELDVLGSVRRRYSSVGTGDEAGGDVDEIFVMVGRPPCGRNWGCCPPGTSRADNDEGEFWFFCPDIIPHKLPSKVGLEVSVGC